MGTFLSMGSGFALWMRIADRQWPDRVSAADLALMTVATQTTSRLLTNSRPPRRRRAARPTRWMATTLVVLFGSEVLQIADRKACDSL